MAKLALINRDKKRRKMVAKFAARRAQFIETINDSKRSEEDRVEARAKLPSCSSCRGMRVRFAFATAAR